MERELYEPKSQMHRARMLPALALLILMGLYLALAGKGPRMPQDNYQTQIETWVALDVLGTDSSAREECIALIRRDERMLRAVIDSLDAEQAEVKLFAMHVLIAAPDLGKDAIPKLARIVEQGGVAGTRLTAAITLGQIGKPAIATLGRLLQHKDPDVRACAADGLCRNSPDGVEAISYLVKAFEDETDHVRMVACESLEEFGDNAIPFLLNLVRDKRTRSSIFAIHLLAKVSPKLVSDQRDSLVSRLDHSDPVVRTETLATIRDMGLETPQLALTIGRRLEDPAEGVRLEAAETLAQFRHLPAEVAPALGRALNEDTELTPLYAIEALERMGAKAKAAVPMLAQAVFSENPYNSESIRKGSIKVLRALGSDAHSAIPSLEEAARRFPDDKALILKAIKAIRQ